MRQNSALRYQKRPLLWPTLTTPFFPFDGEPQAPSAPTSCSCASETRAPFCVYGHSADRSASLGHPLCPLQKPDTIISAFLRGCQNARPSDSASVVPDGLSGHPAIGLAKATSPEKRPQPIHARGRCSRTPRGNCGQPYPPHLAMAMLPRFCYDRGYPRPRTYVAAAGHQPVNDTSASTKLSTACG